MALKPVVEAEFGPLFPRRGNACSRALGRGLLRLFGWRMVGSPPNVPKLMIIAAPHTSNWDGFFLLVAMMAAGLDLRWVGKHTLFKGVLGKFLLWAGGVSVNRSSARDFIGSVVATYAERDSLALVMAPEGTRKPTERWKTGFYRIAKEANVPIVVGYMNYGNKTAGFGPGLSASQDVEDYFDQLRNFVQDITPRHPHRFILPKSGK
jgi:1-acyl-sn-glycerol-3-phosphate acyltransferase